MTGDPDYSVKEFARMASFAPPTAFLHPAAASRAASFGLCFRSPVTLPTASLTAPIESDGPLLQTRSLSYPFSEFAHGQHAVGVWFFSGAQLPECIRAFFGQRVAPNDPFRDPQAVRRKSPAIGNFPVRTARKLAGRLFSIPLLPDLLLDRKAPLGRWLLQIFGCRFWCIHLSAKWSMSIFSRRCRRRATCFSIESFISLFFQGLPLLTMIRLVRFTDRHGIRFRAFKSTVIGRISVHRIAALELDRNAGLKAVRLTRNQPQDVRRNFRG